ncbi:hypothetical protein BOX15_Mlig029900g1 [Macrostomum lignano]|uniref:Uncharacterized protein n=2 Tax=Macrostomum lignano TaxID=282301 RepID=A0A267GX62_9PLAT|nr:hypothetical protein BOX15_Mlig029900g1 [Macrostomum lignano]
MSSKAVLLTAVRPRSDSSAMIDSSLFELVYNKETPRDSTVTEDEELDSTMACAISKKDAISQHFLRSGGLDSFKSGEAGRVKPVRLTREIADLIAWELELQSTPLSPDELDMLYTHSMDRVIVSSERTTF